MEVSTVEGFKYKEYRHPKLERFVTSCTYVIEWLAVVCATILISVATGWLFAPVFPFLYDLFHRMKKHSIYFYDDKGLGPSMTEIFAEDFTHAARYMAFCVLAAWMISPIVQLAIHPKENVTVEQKHESNSECRDKHEVGETESSSVSVDGGNRDGQNP